MTSLPGSIKGEPSPTTVPLIEAKRTQVTPITQPKTVGNKTWGNDEIKAQLKRDTRVWVPGTPHLVGISLQMHYINSIDTVGQQFNCGFYISYEWQPSQSDLDSWAEAKGDPEKVRDWIPEFVPAFRFPSGFCFDQREHKTYLDGSTYCLLTNGEPDTRGAHVDMEFDFMIAARLAIRGTFGQPLELQEFPFDWQCLTLLVKSSAAASVQILVPHFRRKKFVAVSQEVSTLPDWSPRTPLAIFNLSDPSLSARGLQFSDFILILKFERLSKAFLLRIYLILAFITGTAFTMFSIPAEEMADRLGTLLNLLLTAVAFMFVTQTSIPNVPYMTQMDYYVLASFFLLLIMCGYTSLVLVVSNAADYPPEDLDYVFGYIFVGTWVSYNTFFAVWAYITKRDNQKEIVDYKGQDRTGESESLVPRTLMVSSGGSTLPGVYEGEKPPKKPKKKVR